MRRKIALLLAFTMVLSILPMNVFAAMPAVTGGGTRMGMIAEPAGPARNVRDWGDGVAVGRQWIVNRMHPVGPTGISPAPQGNLRHILADAAYFANRNDNQRFAWLTMNIANARRWLGWTPPATWSPAISMWTTLDNNITGGVTQFSSPPAVGVAAPGLPPQATWVANPSQILVTSHTVGGVTVSLDANAATNFNSFIARTIAANGGTPNAATVELMQSVRTMAVIPEVQISFMNTFFTGWSSPSLTALSWRTAPPGMGLPAGFPTFASGIVTQSATSSRVFVWRPLNTNTVPLALVNYPTTLNPPLAAMTAPQQAAAIAFMTSTDNWVQLPIEYITASDANDNPIRLDFFENSGWPQAGQIRPGGGVPGRTDLTAATQHRFDFGRDGDPRTFHRYQRGVLPAIRIAEGAQGAFDDQFWWIELTIEQTGFFFTEDSMEDVYFTTRWGARPTDASLVMGGNGIASGTVRNTPRPPRLGWWDGWRPEGSGNAAPSDNESQIGMLRIEDGPVRREPTEGPNRYRSLIFGVQLPGVTGANNQRTVNDWLDIRGLTIIADDRARDGVVEVKVDLYRADQVVTEQDPGFSGTVVLPGTGGWQWTGDWPATTPGVPPFVPNPGAPQAGGTNNPMPPIGSTAHWSEIPAGWGTNATVMAPENRPPGVPLNANPVQAPGRPPGTFNWVDPVDGGFYVNPVTGVAYETGPTTTANVNNTIWVWRRYPMVPALSVYTLAQINDPDFVQPPLGFWVIDEGAGGSRGTVGTPNRNIPGRDAHADSPLLPGGIPAGPPLRGYGFRPFDNLDSLVTGFNANQLWVVDVERPYRAWSPGQGAIYQATNIPPGPNGQPPFWPHQASFNTAVPTPGLHRVQGAPGGAPFVGGAIVPTAAPAQWQIPPVTASSIWVNTVYGPPAPGVYDNGTPGHTVWPGTWLTGWTQTARNVPDNSLPGHAGPAGSNTNTLTNWHLYGTYTWGAPNVAGEINLTANTGRPYYQRGAHVSDGVVEVGRFGTLGLELILHPDDSAEDHWLLSGRRDWQFSREVTNDGRRPIGVVEEILDSYNHLTARARLRELSPGALAATGANPVTFSFGDGIQILGARIWTNNANFSRFNESDDLVLYGDRFNVADAFLGASIERDTLTLRPEIGSSLGANETRWRTAEITVEFYLSVMPGYVYELGTDEIRVYVTASDASEAGGTFEGDIIVAFAEDPIEVDTTVATVGAVNPAEFGSLHVININDVTITEVASRNLEVGTRLWVGVEGGLSRGFGAADHISLSAGSVEVVPEGAIGISPLRSDTHGAYVEITRTSSQNGAQIIFRDVQVTGRVFADTEYNIIVAGNSVAANWEEFLWLDGDLPTGIARGGIHGFFHEEPYPTPAFVFAGEDVGITELPAPAPPTPAPAPTTPVGLGPTVLTQNVAFPRPNGEVINPPFEMVPTVTDPLNTSTAFISVAAVSDILGWQLSWESPTATFTKPNGDVLVFTLNESTATLNGTPMPMQDALGSAVPARNTNNRLMVPIRFFRDLGINVQWLGGSPGRFSIAVTP